MRKIKDAKLHIRISMKFHLYNLRMNNEVKMGVKLFTTKIDVGLSLIIVLFTIGVIDGNDQHFRPKREVRDCKDKFKVLRTHTACAPRSPNVVLTNSGVSSSDVQLILQEHNKYRGTVTPTASNMAKLSWDAEVAEVAQALAETCVFGHDDSHDRKIPGRFPLGQNIGKGYDSWAAVIHGWYDEYKSFSYNSDTNVFGDVGHYTQLVWATTTKVGCGVADCGSGFIHVCNYAPGGNVGGFKQPYKSGVSCADCSGHCTNKLCDCSGLTCENDGILDMATCTCQCKYPSFQVGTECKLDCSNVTEPFQCADANYVGNCRGAYNVPLECPNACNVCPYGAFNYKEQGVPVPPGGGDGGSRIQLNVVSLCISVVLTMFALTTV